MATYNGIVLLCLALLVAMAGATQFKVGGPNGWCVPSGPNAMSYNQWAERNRFRIGDTLLFVYPKTDSVLLVDQNAYNTCNTSSYIQRFDDGYTVFTFNHSGPFFFISGVEDNCKKNESLIVVVLGDRSGRSSMPPSSSPPPTTPTPSSLPSPKPSLPPSAPSASATSPSPSPAAANVSPPSPSPASSGPSSGPEEGLPPSGEEMGPPPPHNKNAAASLKVAGFISSFGAWIGLALFAL